jgi:succinate dehydrogenase/fumarate reductase flavoprotein subunit
MALLNYTTTVQASKTMAELQEILRRHGAKAILINYDGEGFMESLSFNIITPRGDFGIRLPVQPENILKVLARQNVPKAYRTKEQSIRIAWRIVKAWTQAQMAILETEMVEIDQIFLPYIETTPGKTVYNNFLENRAQLGPGRLDE